ncbi:MarR family winged helix-turn-helix transcriptional regulator [Kribbella karoonensis]|uniref:HTH marR-type domain-containing protein n=1 Tax=Kribbella karoonensis TaxID=324851 RepID=A0ABN2E8M8_9ACTN
MASALSGFESASDGAAVEQASLALVELTLKAMTAAPQLSVLQLRVLLSVERHGPLRLGEVAGLLDLSAPSASRLVARLVDDGLILRNTPPADRRQVQLVVSAKGRRLLTRLRGNRQRDIDRVLDLMSPNDRSALVQGLAAFADASG